VETLMSDYWAYSPDNPFNQMDYTRGGGGGNNSATAESNERRANAFHEGAVQGLPRFASVGVALGAIKTGEMAVVNDRLIKKAEQTRGATPPANTGTGAQAVATVPRKVSAGSALRLSWPLPGYYNGVDAPLGHGPRIANLPQADEDPRFSADVQLERIGVGGKDESMAAISERGHYFTGTGYRWMPSSDLKERIEDGPLEWLWLAENYLLPALGLGKNPADYPPPFLDPQDSHFDGGLFGSWEWRHGKAPSAQQPVHQELTQAQRGMLSGGGAQRFFGQ